MDKIITLDEVTKKALQFAADKKKWSLKKYIEDVLEKEGQKILKQVLSKNNSTPTQ